MTLTQGIKPKTEGQDEREKWYKLVMKILSWKESASHGGMGGMTNERQRITSREWNLYVSKMRKMDAEGGRKTLQDKLEETKKAIERVGGFEA